VGDLIDIQDHTIRLNSVAYQGTTLQTNFTIENLGSSDMNMSSLLSFSAKKADGTLLDIEIFDCPGSSFGGSILTGVNLLRVIFAGRMQARKTASKFTTRPTCSARVRSSGTPSQAAPRISPRRARNRRSRYLHSERPSRCRTTRFV